MIDYRLATMEDLDRIYNMVNCAIDKMISQNILQWDHVYPTKEDFQKDIEEKQLYLGLADNEIAVIYVLNLEYDDEYKNGNWKYTGTSFYIIHRLCVNPSFQNMGFGKSTLLHIEDELLHMGIYWIRLDVFSENPYALNLYRNFGYNAVGYADWRKGRFLLMEKQIIRD